MNHFPRFPLPVHEPYSGPIDCQATCDLWMDTLQEAEAVKALFHALKTRAKRLQALCAENSITCEPDMVDTIQAAESDTNIDGTISHIDGETAKYLEG
jgi:hypothetical protein